MKFRPLRNLSQWIVAVFTFVIALSIACAFSNLAQFNLITKIEAGGDYTNEELATNDSRQMTIGFILIGVIAIVSIMFLIWNYKSYKNIEILRGYPASRSSHWAVTSYFVPILCFFRPCGIMHEIWDESEPSITPCPIKGTGKRWLVGIWWFFFLGAMIWYRLDNMANVENPTIADIRQSSLMAIYFDSWLVLGAASAIFLVRQITNREEQRFLNLIEMYSQKAEEANERQSPPEDNYREEEFADDHKTIYAEEEKAKYYGSILGLKGKITKEDISKTYKQLVALYHPDKVAHLAPEIQEFAERKTKEINVAYQYFKDKYNL
jgi:hypothetical protein